MHTGFILEDLPESQTWLSQVLTESFSGIAITTAFTLAEARQKLARQPPPDIALVDLGLPDGSGVELIAELNRAAPATLCVVASIYDDDSHLFPALRAGARGYLLKDQPRDTLVRALTGIVTGQPPLSPAIARKLLSHFRSPLEDQLEPLTTREKEVLGIIAKGLTMNEVANVLGLSRNTVASYVKEIYRKLNVSSRAEAALSARHMGLV